VGLAVDPGGVIGPELEELGSEASGVGHIGPGEELLVGEGLEDDATVLAALHVEASPGIRELIDLAVFVRIPIRGMRDVLPDDVGGIGEHILDVLIGKHCNVAFPSFKIFVADLVVHRISLLYLLIIV